MTRFLCVADLHLGAGTDYGRHPGDRLAEQENVWQRALDIGADHDVDALLFAGDAFERRRPTPAELLAFARPLRTWDLPMVAIPGNHDLDGVDRACGLDLFASDPDNDWTAMELHREPNLTDVGDVTVCTLPWAPVSRIVAAVNGGDRDDLNAQAAELLVEVARGLRARVEPGRRCVLLTHFSISGASLPHGLPTDDLREPVLDLGALEDLGFDAVVAGHIHKAQMLDSAIGLDGVAPGPIFYTGSPMPLNFGEATVEHGVWILGLDADDFAAEFVPIESRPFVTHKIGAVEAIEITDPEANLGFWPDQFPGAIVKLCYSATAEQARRIDNAKLRAAAEAAGAHRVWAIEAEIVREQRARVAGMDETLDDTTALELWLNANGISLDDHDARRDLLIAKHNRYAEALR